MARMPRLVVPGYPHHITQRGVRRMTTFWGADDYQLYLNLVTRYREEAGAAIWAYCLMPNHVHFVVVPKESDSLSRLFLQVHRQYTRTINFREKWRGHLWQERFHSCVMDEDYLLAAVRYVERNPVKAKLCESAAQWPWSSANAHLLGYDDQVVTVKPMLERVINWRSYLQEEGAEQEIASIKQFSSSGRPAGDDYFVNKLEALTKRVLNPKRPGPKTRVK
jgi:putative transposase